MAAAGVRKNFALSGSVGAADTGPAKTSPRHSSGLAGPSSGGRDW